MLNCGCKGPNTGPEPHSPVPLRRAGLFPNALEWLKKQVDTLFRVKQDALIEGDGIGIDEDNRISVVGKADLINGLVPASQLPSYVDDVLEFDSRDAFPGTGEDGKIYVAKDTNKTYRWSGSVYVGVGGVDLGETASTAHRGDHGKIAYDHSQKRGAGPVTDANPHGTTGSDILAADGSKITVAAGLESKVTKLDSRDIFAKMLSSEFLPLENSGDASFDFSSYSVGQVGERLVLKDAKGEVFATQANDGTFGGVAGVLFGGKAAGADWKPFLIEAAKKSDVPVLSTTFAAQDAGKAADAKAVGDKIADEMTKVTTLKINDEWRFSVAPGISGALAIRLEHLEFPSQGIWGVQTEMTIPTGLGTLAKSADIPEISTTFTAQDAGKAADAKAVGGKLAGKLNTNWSSDISFGWGESDAAIGYRAETYDNALLITDASWGPYFIVRINGTNYTLTFPNQGGRVVLSDEDTNELPEPIKTALFTGKEFTEALFSQTLSPEFLPITNSGSVSFDFSSYSVGNIGNRLVLKDAKGEVFATQVDDGTFAGVTGVLFGGKPSDETWKPFLIEVAKKGDIPKATAMKPTDEEGVWQVDEGSADPWEQKQDVMVRGGTLVDTQKAKADIAAFCSEANTALNEAVSREVLSDKEGGIKRSLFAGADFKKAVADCFGNAETTSY